jgi:hypothetical protein
MDITTDARLRLDPYWNSPGMVPLSFDSEEELSFTGDVYWEPPDSRLDDFFESHG